MTNIIPLSIILVLLILGLTIVYFSFAYKNNLPENSLYVGPVPQGYDEDYFRQTGITKLIEVEK